jgi:hypothetical protein
VKYIWQSGDRGAFRDFESRQALEIECLEKEPYILGKVWKK